MENCVSTRRAPRGLSSVVFVLTLFLLAWTPATASADGDELGQEAGLGAAAALSNLVYGPAKVAYSLGGATMAGIAWVFSGGDSEVAQTVLNRAVRGTYGLTPAVLQGREEIEFVGRAPEYRLTEEFSEETAGAVSDEDLEGW